MSAIPNLFQRQKKPLNQTHDVIHTGCVYCLLHFCKQQPQQQMKSKLLGINKQIV